MYETLGFANMTYEHPSTGMLYEIDKDDATPTLTDLEQDQIDGKLLDKENVKESKPFPWWIIIAAGLAYMESRG